jgi:hypothetical protein
MKNYNTPLLSVLWYSDVILRQSSRYRQHNFKMYQYRNYRNQVFLIVLHEDGRIREARKLN